MNSAARNESEAPETPEHYVLFDTAIGDIGIAWSGQGVTRLALPHPNRALTERRVRGASARPATEMSSHIAALIAAVRGAMRGERTDFDSVAVDLAGVDPFRRSVYEAARTVGFGETLTYGELAKRAGCEGEAQAVGQALAKNPVPIIIPCHRILAAGRRLGGFSAPGGRFTKDRLLALESSGAKEPLLPGIVG